MHKDQWRLAELSPDGEDRVLSAAELDARVDRLAGLLQRLGIGAGDPVCHFMDNCNEIIEIRQACLRTGSWVVPINYHFTAAEARHILADSGAKALFISRRYRDLAAAAVRGLDAPRNRLFSVGGGAGDFFDYEKALQDSAPLARDSASTGPVDIGRIVYTSGTTGTPKGVVRPPAPPADFRLMLERFRQQYSLEGGSTHLVTGPLYHGSPYAGADRCLAMGGRLVIMPRFDAAEVLRAIEKYRVTDTHLVPVMMHRLLALPDAVKERYDRSSLVSVRHGAAPCPPETKAAMIRWWGPVINEYYASTEAGVVASISAAEALERPGSVGKIAEDFTVRILDGEGQPVHTGQVGEIYVHSDMAGSFTYHQAPEKLAAAKKDGFFTNGDMGYFDEEGYLYLVDRKVDMIISGGVNIYPAETEAVLHTHPAVEDCAVFGIPDPEWGEQVQAHVTLKPDRSPDGESLKAWLRERLAGYKVPRQIRFVDDLPRQPNGKIYKRRIREPYWQGHGKRI